MTRQDGFGGFGANGTLSSSATEHQLASRLRVGGGGENGGPAQLRSANPLIERAIRGSHRQRTRTLGLGAPGDALFLKSNPNPDRAHREPPHPMQMGKMGLVTADDVLHLLGGRARRACWIRRGRSPSDVVLYELLETPLVFLHRGRGPHNAARPAGASVRCYGGCQLSG